MADCNIKNGYFKKGGNVMSLARHIHEHVLYGKRYEKLIKRASKLYEGKSRRIFRKELRDKLYSLAKRKIKNKELLPISYQVLSLIQSVVYEALYIREYLYESQMEEIANESLLAYIFEPEDVCIHFPILDKIALMAYDELAKTNPSKESDILMSNFYDIVRIAKEIIDEF